MRLLGVVAPLLGFALSIASSRALRHFSVSLAIVALLAGPQLGFAQICIDPPPIDGAPAVSAAPAGWSVASNSPDLVAGNGPWPGAGYTISDISGASTSGGTTGLFLNEDTFYIESWQTTLTGLTPGVVYQVAVEWQQATLAQDGGGSMWSGGQLRLTVDGNSTDYMSSGSIAGDTWQPAIKVFTAAGTTANLVMGHTPQGGVTGMVVADSGSACQIVGPAGPPLIVPTLSEIGLVAMSLLVGLWAVLALRNRRRNPNRMA